MRKFVTTFLMLLAASTLLLSCGGADEPDEPEYPIDTKEGGSNQGSTPSVDIEEIIKNNVSVKASYSDYTFTFTITSKAKSKLPSYNVEYGIWHGVSFSKPDTSVSIGSQAYYYSTSTNGDTETIVFKNPFWFYFVFGNTDKDKWTDCEMYYKSYIALANKGLSNLSSSEKSLYNDLVKSLNSYQTEAKTFYRPAIGVTVNSKFYKVSTYQIP